MSYIDYGAFVYCNGERRFDKEDVALFSTDEETFGQASENVPSGLRIFVSLLKAKEKSKTLSWVEHIHHGIMGDGNVRVLCHKQGLPEIYELHEDGTVEEVKFYDENTVDYFEYDDIEFEFKGYHFVFRSGKPYYASMTDPDGNTWECRYDYEYGAGWDE